MNSNRIEKSRKETSSPTSRSQFGAVGTAALIALGAFLTGCASTEQAAQSHMVTVKNTRNMRYGEILVVKPTGVDVYNTTGLNDCPAEKWNAMDLDQIKQQFGAEAVQKNGPHYWMMDSQSLLLGEKASFGGIEARYAATVDPAIVQKSAKGSEPYKVFMPKKTQRMVDGNEVDRKTMEHTVPFIFQWDETFDVGMDTGTPVAFLEHSYQCPFKFTGKINKLTYELLPVQIPDLATLQEAAEKIGNARQ